MFKRAAAIAATAVAVLAISDESALAQRCPTGKAPTTIINPAGKAIEVCVAPPAIPHIGGDADIVVPASARVFAGRRCRGLAGETDVDAELLHGTTMKTAEGHPQ